MSAHRALYDLKAADYTMTDPGAGGTITINRQLAVVPVVTAAAEARTLAQPTKAGLICAIVLETRVGDATLTVTGGYNQAADTDIVFDTAGDWVKFHSVKVGASYYWRVLSSEGVSLAGIDNALSGVTAGTAAANKALVMGAASINLGVLGVVRTGRQRVINVGAKLGSGAGWTLGGGAVNTGLMATMAASQTAGTLVVPIPGLKVGDTITAFSLVGQIESAGGAVTLDADLRKHTAAAADVVDASVGAITQIAVTADAIVSAAKSGLAEVVAADETFYILLTGTTAASTDIALQGITITVTES